MAQGKSCTFLFFKTITFNIFIMLSFHFASSFFVKGQIYLSKKYAKRNKDDGVEATLTLTMQFIMSLTQYFVGGNCENIFNWILYNKRHHFWIVTCISCVVLVIIMLIQNVLKKKMYLTLKICFTKKLSWNT